MPKLSEAYQDLMERLDGKFPGRELVRKGEVAEWLGISKSTFRARYKLPPGQYVTKSAVARALEKS